MDTRPTNGESQDLVYMRIALDHARFALARSWVPVGAVLVHSGRVIAHGIKLGTHHVRLDHAEHNGINQALWSRQTVRDLAGTTLYSTLEPCILCMSMIMTTRVSRVVYGLEDPYGGGSFILNAPNISERFRTERPAVKGGVLREESGRLLGQFFANPTTERSWGGAGNPLIALARSHA